MAATRRPRSPAGVLGTALSLRCATRTAAELPLGAHLAEPHELGPSHRRRGDLRPARPRAAVLLDPLVALSADQHERGVPSKPRFRVLTSETPTPDQRPNVRIALRAAPASRHRSRAPDARRCGRSPLKPSNQRSLRQQFLPKGDGLQAMASSPRSPEKVWRRKLGSSQVTDAYYGRTSAEDKEITWRDSCRRIGCNSSLIPS